MTFSRLFFTIGLALICAGPALAVSGGVVDPAGHPLPWVSVVTNVEAVHAVTDSSGRFELRDDDAVTRVTFSSVGYEARQFRASELPATIVLQPAYVRGSDIVVRAGTGRAGPVAGGI